MFDALLSLFQRKNMNRKMILRNKIILVQMSISDNVTSYLISITEVCDELASIWEKKEDGDLVNVALNRIPKSWNPLSKEFVLKRIS
jgi:hypothetical protein